MISAQENPVRRRLLKISRLNGRGVVAFAGIGAIISLFTGDGFGLVVGILAVICGAMELRGHEQVQEGQSEGVKWLVWSQAALFLVVALYVASQLYSGPSLLGGEEAEALKSAGIDQRQLMGMISGLMRTVYLTVLGVTALYQGWMAYYYYSRGTQIFAVGQK